MILWVTSFNEKLYEVSGGKLLGSFAKTNSFGHFYIGTEGNCGLKTSSPYYVTNLDHSSYLQNWLKEHEDIIPEHLGGTLKPCNCPDPWARSDKKHLQINCPHTWFNRNASKWFRKIATLKHALQFAKNTYNFLIWIDADCRFTNQVTLEKINDLFEMGTNTERDVLFLKANRPVMEAGFVAYNLACCKRSGYDLLIDIFDVYKKDFRNLYRYDDSYVIQKCLKRGYKPRDIASKKDPMNHSDVFKYSLIGDLIVHDKGKHGRQLGIMK